MPKRANKKGRLYGYNQKKRKKKSNSDESVASSDCDSDLNINVSPKRVKQNDSNDSNETNSIQPSTFLISTSPTAIETSIPKRSNQIDPNERNSIQSTTATSIPSIDIAASKPLTSNQRKKRNRKVSKAIEKAKNQELDEFLRSSAWQNVVEKEFPSPPIPHDRPPKRKIKKRKIRSADRNEDAMLKLQRQKNLSAIIIDVRK